MNATVARQAAVVLGIAMLVIAGCSDDDGGLQGSSGAPTTVAVAGRAAAFAVGRVYCIGRNYKWRQNEAAPAEMPAWFMKPADAVVPASGALPYPPGTSDFCHEIELVVAIGRGEDDRSDACEHQPAQAVLEDRLPRDGGQRLALEPRRSQPCLEDDAGARPHHATSPMRGRASQTGRRRLDSSRKNDVS